MNADPRNKTISVRLIGLNHIMFSPPNSENLENPLPPERMLEREADGTIILMADRLFAFLHSEKGMAVSKLLFEQKMYKTQGTILKSLVSFDPVRIPFLRDGKPIKFEGFGRNGIEIDRRTGFTGKPHLVERPKVMLPWELEFRLFVYEGEGITETLVRDGFERGGIIVGLGSYRQTFGKFKVAQWDII